LESYIRIQRVCKSSTFSCPDGFEDFCANTTELHVALHNCNSGAESSGELFKGFNDAASLLVCTQKKFFGWGCRFFVSNIISGGLLGHFRPLHLALGPNR